MPILSTDFIWRQPRSISATVPSSNGGTMSATPITTGVKNNLFPDVTQAQRTAGALHYRKAFIHVASSTPIELLDARVYISQATPADDAVLLIPGTETDTEDQISGRAYGAASLFLDAATGAASIDIVPEALAAYGSDFEPFQAGDLIRISDGTATEWHTVDTVTEDSDGAYWTLTLDGTTLGADFSQMETLVSSVHEVASVLASVDGAVVTSPSGGALDDTAIVAFNKGAITDTITLTFTSATAFTAAGLLAGSLGTGNRNATFSPVNAGIGTPYFSIPSTAWSGTFALGDTVIFDLHPAAIPLWYARLVPAGAGSLASDSVVVSVYGESAS